LALAEFKASNGFGYQGYAAQEQIDASEVLLRVPQALLLTSRLAYQSELKTFFEENIAFFGDT
jgi:hypothetical protein